MREKEISKLYNSITNVNDQFIEAAQVKMKKKKNGWLKWGAMAACFCLAVAVVAVSVLSPFGGMVVTAYAHGIDQEITAAGTTFTTGTLKEPLI